MTANPRSPASRSHLIPRELASARRPAPEDLKRVDGTRFDIELKPFLSPPGLQALPGGSIAGVDLATQRSDRQHQGGTIPDSFLPFKLGVPGRGAVVTVGGVACFSGTPDTAGVP